jgi:hypothetical protein
VNGERAETRVLAVGRLQVTLDTRQSIYLLAHCSSNVVKGDGMLQHQGDGCHWGLGASIPAYHRDGRLLSRLLLGSAQ